MLDFKKQKTSRLIGFFTLFSLIGGLTCVAFASNVSGFHHMITRTKAEEMAAKIKNNGTFPLVVNEPVLKQLNRIFGTSQGRHRLKKSLENKRKCHFEGASCVSLMSSNLERYSVPQVLMSIPIVESRFLNVRQEKGPFSAGLWMFIPDTARAMGLRVDAQVDERLNIAAESRAAGELLQILFQRYQDWHLAVIAYNSGEKAVDSWIQKTGSTNAWDLIAALPKEDSYDEMRTYLPTVIATMLAESLI